MKPHDPVMVVHTCGLLGIVGTPGQVRARLGALGAAPFDAAEVAYLDQRARIAPDTRVGVVARGAAQLHLFGGGL